MDLSLKRVQAASKQLADLHEAGVLSDRASDNKWTLIQGAYYSENKERLAELLTELDNLVESSGEGKTE